MLRPSRVKSELCLYSVETDTQCRTCIWQPPGRRILFVFPANRWKTLSESVERSVQSAMLQSQCQQYIHGRAKNGAAIKQLFHLAFYQALAISNLRATFWLSSEPTVDLFCMDFCSSLKKKHLAYSNNNAHRLAAV